ncbi:hypothetical protein GEV33_001422 [Tenebrio molitor]|uniref:Uncharacterized protein n=1 Tax=Tenebrio molitor TaxID=7067 RepID=A0A8J6HV20_TENMO|nr:hypothetical protein GEV33_001422 [Tenebrio molitor]
MLKATLRESRGGHAKSHKAEQIAVIYGRLSLSLAVLRRILFLIMEKHSVRLWECPLLYPFRFAALRLLTTLVSYYQQGNVNKTTTRYKVT